MSNIFYDLLNDDDGNWLSAWEDYWGYNGIDLSYLYEYYDDSISIILYYIMILS